MELEKDLSICVKRKDTQKWKDKTQNIRNMQKAIVIN